MRSLSEPYLNALGLAVSQGNISQDSIRYTVKNIFPLFLKAYLNRLRDSFKNINPDDEKSLIKAIMFNKDSFPVTYQKLKSAGGNMNNIDNVMVMLGDLPKRMEKDPLSILVEYYDQKSKEFIDFYVNQRKKSPDEAKKIVETFGNAYKTLLSSMSKEFLQKLAEGVYKSHLDNFESIVGGIAPGIIASASDIPDEELILMKELVKQQYNQQYTSKGP